jgi:hypothetical protein
MSKGEVRLFKRRNVWMRKHNQRKLNQRLKWYEEMDKTGEMPDAMIEDMQDAARRNAGHEPDPPMGIGQLGLSFLNHPRGG